MELLLLARRLFEYSGLLLYSTNGADINNIPPKYFLIHQNFNPTLILSCFRTHKSNRYFQLFQIFQIVLTILTQNLHTFLILLTFYKNVHIKFLLEWINKVHSLNNLLADLCANLLYLLFTL